MPLLRDQQTAEVKRITDRVYDVMRDRFDVKLFSYPAVRRRVMELIDAYDNVHMVAVAVDEIVASEGTRFSPMSLTLARVGQLIQRTKISEDVWEYERWFRTLEDGTPLQQEVEYLLAIWRDVYRAGEDERGRKVQAELSRLKIESVGEESLGIIER